MRNRFVDVDILSLAEAGLVKVEINPVPEQVIKISRRKGVIDAKPLLKPGLEGASFFGLQGGIGESWETTSVPK